MRDVNSLFTLVRGVLLSGLAARYGADAPDVLQVFQPSLVGASVRPTVTMQRVSVRRIGAPGRRYKPSATQDGAMISTTTEWLEVTLQIGAFARRDPSSAGYMVRPLADDYCQEAASVLQSDEGLAALGAAGVRPLRITGSRTVQWVDESGRYESFPSFDMTVSFPHIIEGETAFAGQFEPNAGRV